MRGLWLSVILAGGCRAPESGPAIQESSPVLGHYRLPQEDLRGASGLDRGPRGGFWSVLERRRYVYRLRVDGSGVRIEASLPIAGVADGLDLEAAAWIDPETVALGTVFSISYCQPAESAAKP